MPSRLRNWRDMASSRWKHYNLFSKFRTCFAR